MIAPRCRLRVAAIAGLLCIALLPAQAAEQADRALEAVRQLIASGEIKPGASIKVAFKPGNINALLGAELELQKEWEQKTGTTIRARVIPQKPALINLKGNPDIDITVARTHEFPDLVSENLIEDLTPLVQQFGFKFDDNNRPDAFIRLKLQADYGERLFAIPADGDITIFYLRKDLLDNPAERAAFRKAYGRELAIPETWGEYQDLAKFFHRPGNGLYGVAEIREKPGGWMTWLPRYLGQSLPYRRLFDENMRPLIASPAGIAATDSYIAIVRHSPPEILDDGKDYSYTMPMFMQGKVFMTTNTIAAAKLFNGPASEVKGKFLAFPTPGQRVGKQIVRHNTLIYGNNLVISNRSTQKKLAFLFTLWLTDPEISLRTVGAKGGHTDPYRWNHLQDPRIRDLYTPQALAVFGEAWKDAFPPGTGLPGDSQYLDALDQHLWLAAKGEISAAEAMRRTATEWERITEARGRPRQIEYLQSFMKGFSSP